MSALTPSVKFEQAFVCFQNNDHFENKDKIMYDKKIPFLMCGCHRIGGDFKIKIIYDRLTVVRERPH